MKILTDFRKTGETGMDPRLGVGIPKSPYDVAYELHGNEVDRIRTF